MSEARDPVSTAVLSADIGMLSEYATTVLRRLTGLSVSGDAVQEFTKRFEVTRDDFDRSLRVQTAQAVVQIAGVVLGAGERCGRVIHNINTNTDAPQMKRGTSRV